MIAAALVPAAAIPGGGLIALFAGATAVVGFLVAALAYEGSRRNGSRPMAYLAAGILCLTTIPVSLNYALVALTTATDAEILLVISVAHLAGVASILYALTRA
ncbi:DUF7521 family protein [Natronosalvus caseinilyticus]|uniref:DUF7521 family protein n=1 Tax=Natronosalvus caseinilyticus TaxID=2953747 RepID=UPI0028A95490|nr:hypothetical protein [Natronosalvus caseinilyticus]